MLKLLFKKNNLDNFSTERVTNKNGKRTYNVLILIILALSSVLQTLDNLSKYDLRARKVKL